MDLLFITLPKALSLVAGSSFWTVLYFLMTFLLSLNHQVCNTIFPKTSGSNFFILKNTTLLAIFDLLHDSDSHRLVQETIPLTGKTPVAHEEANLSVLPHQVVLVESLATNVSDLLPRDLRKRFARELLVLAICGLCLLVGLLVITKVNSK